MKDLLVNVWKTGKGAIKGILKEYGIEEKESEEFLSKLDQQINIELQNTQTNNNSINYGVPWEKYENCIKEKANLEKEENAYFVFYKESEFKETSSLKVVEVEENMEIFARTKNEAIKNFENLKNSNQTFLKILSKEELPRFTSEDIINLYKNEIEGLYRNIDSFNNFLNILTTYNACEFNVIQSFLIRHGIKHVLEKLPNKRTLILYAFSDQELDIIKNLKSKEYNS